MVKRLIDFFSSALGLIVVSPVMLPVMFLVWLQDRHSPFYIADRVGYRGKNFRMVKLRSMVVNADKSGIDSTSANDMRITAVGHFIRRFKLDELSQLWNVMIGDMSLVGPRPNPWKSRTGLLYIEKQGLALDLALIALTVIAIVSKRRALAILSIILQRLDAPDELIAVAAREHDLTPHAPPGADRPVVAADLGHG